MKKALLGFVIGSALVAIPLAASAQSTSLSAQIDALLAQIKTLQTQIATLVQQAKTSGTGAGSAISSTIGTISPSTVVSSGGWCTITRTLAQGSTGSDVTNLQTFLQNEGTFSGTATGYYGTVTAGAVAKWQSSQGLSPVGIVGPMTRQQITAHCGGTSALQAYPSSGPSPLTVSFWYLLGGASADNYALDYGDNTIDTATVGCGGNPNSMMMACPRALTGSHTYSKDGVYTATLKFITNPCPVGAQCFAGPIYKNIASVTITVGASSACRPLTYMPILCPDGNPATGVKDSRGCLTGYTCDRAVSTNKPPVVSSFSGPTTLALNTSGTWSISASDPENGTLSYHITWGDEQAYPTLQAMSSSGADVFVQTTTFTHSYATAGTYTVSITVRDSAGATAAASATVQVGSGTVCNMIYAPVCGQPPEPACRKVPPYCAIATQGPTTYSNRCMMEAAGATLIHDGSCDTGIACTSDAMFCPDGSYVGRTGPYCQFVCPTTTGTGTLSGTESIGPICPVETYPPQPQCQPTADTYAAHQIFVYSGLTLVSTITANLGGSFSGQLNAGDYTLQVENASCSGSSGTISCSGIGSGGSIPVHITAGMTTTETINVDTGIR